MLEEKNKHPGFYLRKYSALGILVQLIMPVHNWFLKTAFVHNVSMCVCPRPKGIHMNGPCVTS